MEIRFATKKDAAACLEIYRPYVEKKAITFEYGVPSVTEFARRIEATAAVFPYFVALEAGEIIGYAYASRTVNARLMIGLWSCRLCERK